MWGKVVPLVVIVLMAFGACQWHETPVAPQNKPMTMASNPLTAVTVHDYTNVTVDPGHLIVPDGQAGAALVAWTGPITVGRGGTLPLCPYDDTWTGGLFAPTNEDHAMAFDRLWFQIVSFSASATFDLGALYNKVYVALSQDHGPYPEEALEYRVWVSNNMAGPYTMLPTTTPITSYVGGWTMTGEPTGDCNANGVLNDDYSALWYLPGNYRYVRLTPIANTGGFNEPEIDAVMGIGPKVLMDIKPGSCPNPFNLKAKGVLPVALLTSDTFDATAVDPATVLLEGVAPIRWSVEDVATPFAGEECECTEDGPDGWDDLALKFDRQEIAAALGIPSHVVTLTITGMLWDGTPFAATDCIWIKPDNTPEIRDWDDSGTIK